MHAAGPQCFWERNEAIRVPPGRIATIKNVANRWRTRQHVNRALVNSLVVWTAFIGRSCADGGWSAPSATRRVIREAAPQQRQAGASYAYREAGASYTSRKAGASYDRLPLQGPVSVM